MIEFNTNKLEGIIWTIKCICMEHNVLRLYVSIELLNALIKHRQHELYNFQADYVRNHCTIFGIAIIAKDNLHGLEAYYADLISLFTWVSSM